MRKKHYFPLAAVLESSHTADAEELAVHFEGGGEQDQAGRYYTAAAQGAAAALAFEHAAELLQQAEAAMKAEGIHDTDRMTAVYANGFALQAAPSLRLKPFYS